MVKVSKSAAGPEFVYMLYDRIPMVVAICTYFISRHATFTNR